MSDILFDESLGDIAIVDGDLVYITSQDVECAQAVTISLRCNKGELFSDTEFGFPYLANDANLQQLLGSKDIDLIDITIKEVILSNPEVYGIKDYSSSQDPLTGTLTIQTTVTTESGDIQFETEI